LSLISRYVFREASSASLVVIVVLLVIFMSNQFAEILGDAAANALPKEAVFEVLRLTFLRYLTFLAPIGILLGIMVALARLNRDSEMAALAACGIGPAKLMRPIAAVTVLAAGGVAWLALVEAPQASRRIEEIRFAARETLDLDVLEPGRFTTPDSGRTVLYAREVEGNELRGVFLEREQDGRVVVVTAARGQRVQGSGHRELTFLLYDGRLTEGIPGEPDFLIADFEEQGMPIRFDEPEEFVESAAIMPTEALLGSADAMDRAELQWRLSSPISILVLALLALPLSRSSPREGRYARVGVGLLIYFIYANALSIARLWIERGTIPEWLGMWWVHAALALVATAMLLQASGALARPRPFAYDVKTRHEPAA
jgi:lipopolysaccharide export system permease protein